MSTNFAQRRSNAWSHDECTLPYVQSQLRAALNAIDRIGRLHDGTLPLPEKYVAELKIAFEATHELARYLPEVECWCVVKHYAGHVEGVDPWEPRVWIGCLSKEQAEAFAPAIEKHYARYDRETGVLARHDTFRAEYRACSITDIVAPDLTAERYLGERLR